MTVIRRLDAVLEPTKEAVLKLNRQLDEAGVANKQGALCQASGNAFYNISPFTLRDLRARTKQHQLRADFEACLDGLGCLRLGEAYFGQRSPCGPGTHFNKDHPAGP